MMQYSLLDIPALTVNDMVDNVTVRFDEGCFAKTIITFDPIKLINEGTRISYGLVIQALVYNGKDMLQDEGVQPQLSDIMSQAVINKLYSQADDIFINVLQLLKNNITMEQTND